MIEQIQAMTTSKRRSISISQTKQNKFVKIFNKNSNLVLRPQIRQKKNQDDDIKIMGGIQDNKSIKQLWLIKNINTRQKYKKQIVNFYTDLVINSDNGYVRLQKGGSKGSKFQIQYINININNHQNNHQNIDNIRDKDHGKRYMRIKDQNNLYLTLDGILQADKLQQSQQSQIFYEQEVDINIYQQFQQSFIIVNHQTGKCLDVMRGQKKVGTPVCVFQFNNRANQRWLFQPKFVMDQNQNIDKDKKKNQKIQNNQKIQKKKDKDKDKQQQQKYSIINMLSGLRLGYNKNNQLIQNDNHQKIWQFTKKQLNSVFLYYPDKRKYVNRKQQDNLILENNSNGTKWEIV